MKHLRLMALSALFTLPAMSANADALLFPYIASASTIATIVSVVNRDADGRLFLEYFYKIDLDHNSECNSTGRREVDSAQNDLVSFEANNLYSGSVGTIKGGPLFNDPSSNVTYAANDFTMNQPMPKRAYLIVDDNDTDGPDLVGEALVLEANGGAAWGYRAYNPVDNDYLSPDFDRNTAGLGAGETNDIHGEVLDAGNSTDDVAIAIMPYDEWITKLFVTAIGDNNQRLCADCSVEVELNRAGEGTAGLYDRDTNPLTGTEEIDVVCVTGINLDELMPATVEATINQQGGWGYVDIDTGGSTTKQGTTGNTENAAVVLKLDYNRVQYISPNMSSSFTGLVNAASWLQKRVNADVF